MCSLGIFVNKYIKNTGWDNPVENFFTSKLPSSSEMAAFDAFTIQTKTPGIQLMERAGLEIFRVIESKFADILQAKKKKVLVLCGPGNNGGDGFVIARHLLQKKIDLAVIVVTAKKYSVDIRTEAQKFVEAGGKFFIFPDPIKDELGSSRGEVVNTTKLKALLEESSIIVDALLGTGQKDAPKGSVGELLGFFNKSLNGARGSTKIVSVDTPTGMNTDTGEVFTPHVRADLTVTIELIKRGLLQYPGRDIVGELIVAPIGIDCSGRAEFSSITEESVPRLPARRIDAHKGNFGHVLVIGGSKNMPGAPILSAISALRVGSGLVTQVRLESVPLAPSYPEILFESVADRKGVFNVACLSKLKEKISKMDVLIIGPGIGTAKETSQFVLTLLDFVTKLKIPSVVDADALNILSGKLSKKAAVKLPFSVLTPHPGEMARLLNLPTEKIQSDRYQAAKVLSEKTKSVVVLKGAASVVYAGAEGHVNTSGNPYMATAGSGDVLSGIIAGLIAQGLSISEAARLGVYIHGKAGDMALKRCKGPIIAGDIVANIAEALGIQS